MIDFIDISDFWYRTKIRIQLYFTKDPKSRKELLVALALFSKEGRKALAIAMIEPIRRSLEYQSIGRKLLMVEELPESAYLRHEKYMKDAEKQNENHS